MTQGYGAAGSGGRIQALAFDSYTNTIFGTGFYDGAQIVRVPHLSVSEYTEDPPNKDLHPNRPTATISSSGMMGTKTLRS
jgi:hypothetical protein